MHMCLIAARIAGKKKERQRDIILPHFRKERKRKSHGSQDTYVPSLAVGKSLIFFSRNQKNFILCSTSIFKACAKCTVHDRNFPVRSGLAWSAWTAGPAGTAKTLTPSPPYVGILLNLPKVE